MSNEKKVVRLIQRQGEHSGKRYTLKKDRVSLGSDPASQIVIKGSFVSPEHAIINRRDDGLWMISNLSVNRTLVNQQEVDTQQLVSGDMIQIGAETLFEFEVVDKKAKKEKSRPRAKKTGPISRRPMVQVALLAYLLLLVVAGVVLKGMSTSGNDITLSAEEVDSVLAASRTYLTSDEYIHATSRITLPIRSIKTEDAALYYQLVSTLTPEGSTTPSDSGPLLDALLEDSRNHLYRAWKYERQLRWKRAIEEYQAVLAAVPDIRIPLVRFVTRRIKFIQEKVE